MQPCNMGFRLHIFNFWRKKKKAEKTDATTQHWFSHIKILPPKKLSFLLIQETFLMQQCHTDLETHPWNFQNKRWKKLTQPCNTDFRTHISNFLRKKKKAEKGWRNNATLIFIHLDSTTKKAEFPFCTEVFSHATLPHWYWNAPIKF